MRLSMRSAGRPVTILDLRDSPWVDGPGRTILDCAEDLDPDRFRVIVCTFDGGNAEGTSYEHEARQRGLLAERIHERRSLDLDVIRQSISLGRRHGADLVHTHDFRSDLVGFVAGRSLRRPWVATVHGWIANDLKARLSTALDKQILRQADHLIAVSEQTRQRLGRWAVQERCTVIPNALRVDKYQPRRGPGPFRSALGIREEEVLVANIGRLSPEKGQFPFLAVARDIVREHAGLRFVLFGIGPDRDRLVRFVEQNGLQEAVIFAGYRSDMGRIYNEVDLVVQSSFTEGMPNVVLEALLMEVPVIATDVGGTSEVLIDGVTGVLVPPDRHSAMLAALGAFLADRRRFEEMARMGRDDVLKRFDHRKRVECLSQVYERLTAAIGREH